MKMSPTKSMARRSSFVDNPTWHPIRRLVGRVIQHPDFEVCIIAAVFGYLALVVYDADIIAKDYSTPEWMSIAKAAFISAFTFEVVIRLYVLRREFFSSSLDVIDAVCVLLDLTIFISAERAQVSVLRVMRMSRLLKLIRSSRSFRELWLMIHGLATAMKAIMWACALIFLLLLVISVIMIEFLHPINVELVAEGQYTECPICDEAFSGVFNTFITLFLLVFMGELWADLAVPIVRRAPWSSCIFCLAFFAVSLGLLNLILAVIVDRAEQARSEDKETVLLAKHEESVRVKKMLMRQCCDMDADGSGELTLDEIQEGFSGRTANRDFQQALELMDVGEADLGIVFDIMDEDGSGSVTYSEFVEQLYKMKHEEAHTMLVFIKHYTIDIRKKIQQQLEMVGDHLGKQLEDDKREMTSNLSTIARSITRLDGDITRLDGDITGDIHASSPRYSARDSWTAVDDTAERLSPIINGCLNSTQKVNHQSTLASKLHKLTLVVSSEEATSLSSVAMETILEESRRTVGANHENSMASSNLSSAILDKSGKVGANHEMSMASSNLSSEVSYKTIVNI